MKIFIFIAGLAVYLLPSLASAGTWSPIAGIPMPPFGIAEEVPTAPAPWSDEVSGFYYVCPTCSGSGDFDFGTPAAPRNRAPRAISGGEVIMLAGDNNGGSYEFSCSSDSPCYMVGDPANPPTMIGNTNFGGSYYIIDGVSVTVPSNYSGGTMRMSGSYGVFRNGRVSGTPNNGGASTKGSYHLLLNNQIVDNGDVGATSDQDRHGLKVGGNHIWIIGNEFARNSGDGIQVGGVGTRDSVHHIYIGGNVSHGNKQTGFWVKEAQHVVISENLAYDHKPSGSSSGEGFGGQYDPTFVWFIFNESRDNIGGIGFKSGNNGAGTNFYVIGNYIHNNINSNYSPNDGWTLSSIFSWNQADITIVNNTIIGNSGGINLNGRTGPATIYNNTIMQMQTAGAVAVLVPDSDDIEFLGSNAMDGDQTVDSGIDPLSSNDPYTIFQTQYGMDIHVDFDGNIRPIRQWDIGAYELQSATGPRPNPPELRIEGQ